MKLIDSDIWEAAIAGDKDWILALAQQLEPNELLRILKAAQHINAVASQTYYFKTNRFALKDIQ